MRVTSMQPLNIERPKLSLSYYFVAWKLLLLLVALASPGPGYDTSTSLALEPVSTNSTQGSRFIQYGSESQWDITLKLTRWDALYFTKVAHDGYTYEQEWMAGFGFTRLLGFLSSFGTSLQQMALVSLVGVGLAHAAHLISVLILYDLGLCSLGRFPQPQRSAMAFLAACLHIISPAGIFLSAPYAESLFSLMTFFGFYLYVQSLSPLVGVHCVQKDIFLLLAGLCLGLATTIRANGLLNGLIFVYEAVTSAHGLFTGQRLEKRRNVQHLCVVFCAGALMGCISFFPQYLAYLEYCVPIVRRPWCSKLIPSIYTWIQSEYWYVEIGPVF
jgi:phosphatidylinositol glycan class V